MRRPTARYLQRMESPLTTARFLRSNTDKAHTCQTVQAGSGGRRQAAHLEPAGPLAAILEPLLLGHGHGGVHVAHRREALFARHPYWGNRACYKTTVHEPASLTAANQRRPGRPGPELIGAASASPCDAAPMTAFHHACVRTGPLRCQARRRRCGGEHARARENGGPPWRGWMSRPLTSV